MRSSTSRRATSISSTRRRANLTSSPLTYRVISPGRGLNTKRWRAPSAARSCRRRAAARRPGRGFNAVWSPDSRWVAYSKSLDSHLRALFLYSLAERKAYQVTDGLSDATSPAFDAGGKYLYFLASTNYALRTGWLEMSSVDRPVTRAIYLVVLSANEPSPLLPETGDEPVIGSPIDAKPRETGPIRVDIHPSGHRILSINVPAGDYTSLKAAAAGVFFYTEAGPTASSPSSLHRYQLKERKAAP